MKSKIKYLAPIILLIIYYVSSLSLKKNAQIEPKPIEIFSKRNLLSIQENHTDKCVRPDIEQFPKLLLNQKQRKNGGVLIHLFISVYMFIALALVCDDYFVPSLEKICKIFSIREDIAGATFMAAGSSAPELATTVISLFIAKDIDIGIGTVVGSAVFNIMFVVSIVSLLSGMIICVSWYPIMRDSFFYLISILVMIIVIMDEKVYWYEATVLLVIYGTYIITMVFNQKIQNWVYLRCGFLVKIGLIQVSDMDINNYNTLSHTKTIEMNKINSTTSLNMAENLETQSQRDEFDKQFDSNDLIENYTPFSLPGKEARFIEKLRYFVCWPLYVLLYITIPDCRKTYWQKYFIFTFLMSLVWLSIFSYVMVWMITIIGYTFAIPDTIMGITLIAFGASVPDALSSLLVAKNGQGDMAISNAIGSNVFDILVCLGIPWLFRSFSIEENFIKVKSRGLIYSSITLFGTVIILIIALRVNKWQLDKKLGIFLMLVYVFFIFLASLYEMNILGSNHLPMCLDSVW